MDIVNKTTRSKVSEFFTLPIRNYDSNDLTKLFDDSFNEDPSRSLQILFHLCDSRNSKCDKELMIQLLHHLMNNYPKNFDANIQALITDYGCYQILCELYARDFHKRKKLASLKPLNILADALSEGLPLAGKWTPSEHGHYNHKKKGYQVTKICQLLGLVRKNKDGDTRPDYQAYRKLVSPLRTKANILKQLSSLSRWNDETQELQWKQMVENIEELCLLKNDVSQHIKAYVAFGVFISEVTERKIMTFSEKPRIIEVRGQTLAEKVKSVQSDCMGYIINYVMALRSILEYGKLFQITQENMPSAIFVFTNMEFDTTDKNCSKTLCDEYKAAGYLLPKIIFRNLACHRNVLPIIQRDGNIALVSRFNQTFMELGLQDIIDPLIIMNTTQPHIQ